MTNTVKAKDGKTYALPKKPVWRKGPPPEIGWWPASINRNPKMLRWWDGVEWGLAAEPTNRESYAAALAKKRPAAQGAIRWTDRWWLNQPEGFPK
jgi:hypothetical protein